MISGKSHIKIFCAYLSILAVSANFAAADTASEIHYTIISNTAVTFDWVGPASQVHYGTESGALASTVTAVASNILPVSSPWESANPGPFREAKLTGLTQGTIYFYKIGDDGVEHTFKTPPAPGSSDFVVVSVSDLHFSDANMTAIMNDIAAVNPSVVIIPGDITGAKVTGQANVDICFNDFMAWSQDVPLMPAWGNHEWDVPTADDLRNYKGRFDLPNPQAISQANSKPDGAGNYELYEDWCWFDYGNVRFITLPEPWKWTGTWSEWVPKATNLMSAAQADPNIKFIITYGHRPVYGSKITPDATWQGWFNGLGDQFSKYVLHLCGHSHYYERTTPQHGVVHIIDGAATGIGNTGGCPQLYNICPPPAWSAFRGQRWGFVKLHITANRIEGCYVCGPPGGGTNDISCSEGETVDSFTIVGPQGDLSKDGKVNMPDFARFAAHWLETDCAAPGWCGGSDIEETDSTVDFRDLKIFAGNWLGGF